MANLSPHSKNRPITGEAAPPLLSPQKLEEILPSVVNRLSPSNLKRTANSLMDEWEKSLVSPPPPESGDKENEAA